MYRNGHIGAGWLAYAPLGFVTAAAGFGTLALLGGVVVAALAMAPDYDLRVPVVPHRGPTHTVWFALVVAAVLGAVGFGLGTSGSGATPVVLGAFGFAVGAVTVGSHVAADALTPAGVRPFAPLWRRHYTLAVVRADNSIANYVLLGAGAAAALAGLGAGVRVATALG